MATLPAAKFWDRQDTTGAEHTLVDARTGLYARGTQLAVDPIAYTCRYEIQTDPAWTTSREAKQSRERASDCIHPDGDTLRDQDCSSNEF